MVALAEAAERGRKRDYSLLGADAERAVETGLKAAEWYHTEVPRKEMKALMQRADQPAIRDTILWLGSMAAFAGIATLLWLSGHPWLSLPFWLAYGVLYGSASDSRWRARSPSPTAEASRWRAPRARARPSWCVSRSRDEPEGGGGLPPARRRPALRRPGARALR